MVKLMDIYDAFLAKVNEDDWARCYTKEDLEWFIQDWRAILNSAMPYFKFPRCSFPASEKAIGNLFFLLYSVFAVKIY